MAGQGENNGSKLNEDLHAFVPSQASQPVNPNLSGSGALQGYMPDSGEFPVAMWTFSHSWVVMVVRNIWRSVQVQVWGDAAISHSTKSTLK